MSGGMHPHPEALYYHISADSSAAASIEQDEFHRKQLGAIAIVFAALCLEAFINQEYDRLHLEAEKLKPLRKKWLELPGKVGVTTSFDEGHEPFSTFDELIALRNDRLVHFKPPLETRIEGLASDEIYFGDLVGDPTVVGKYFRCCAAMIQELNRLTEGKTEIPAFLASQRYMSDVWASSSAAWESTGPQPARGNSGQPNSAA